MQRHYVFTALGMTTEVPGKVGIHIFSKSDLREISSLSVEAYE